MSEGRKRSKIWMHFNYIDNTKAEYARLKSHIEQALQITYTGTLELYIHTCSWRKKDKKVNMLLMKVK